MVTRVDIRQGVKWKLWLRSLVRNTSLIDVLGTMTEIPFWNVLFKKISLLVCSMLCLLYLEEFWFTSHLHFVSRNTFYNSTQKHWVMAYK